MPDIKFAAADVSAMKLGTTAVTKVMLGTFEMWPGIVAPAGPPTLFAAGALAAHSSGTSITPVMPASIQVNDVAILPVMCSAFMSSFSTPSGWTAFGTAIVADSNQSTAWFWKRLTGSEGNPTVTTSSGLSTSVGGYGRIYVFRGCVTSGTPFEAVTMAGAPTLSSQPATAAITTTGTNRTAVCLVMVDDDNSWTAANPPSGWSICGSIAATQTGGDAMFDAISKELVSAVLVPSVVVGNMSGSDYWRTMTLALIPA